MKDATPEIVPPPPPPPPPLIGGEMVACKNREAEAEALPIKAVAVNEERGGEGETVAEEEGAK